MQECHIKESTSPLLEQQTQSNGLFTLPGSDTDSDSDLDCKPYGYCVELFILHEE